MTTDPIAAAIDHIRSVTPADNPWTADDVSSFSPWEPDESDYAIATILNAVASGQLINRASRDEMLAEARLEGWRSGRDAAARCLEQGADEYSCGCDPFHCRCHLSIEQMRIDAEVIRDLPEPKETNHE